VELLVIAAIIMLIASIAIPSLMRSRIAANEAAAAATLRTINTAESAYYAAYQDLGYSKTLAALSSGGGNCASPNSGAACLIDETLAAGLKDGYSFTYTPETSGTLTSNYSVNANPQNAATGVKTFFTDQSAVIRADSGRQASGTSAPI
jgi:type II secretory pathway pseudopilin PulG